MTVLRIFAQQVRRDRVIFSWITNAGYIVSFRGREALYGFQGVEDRKADRRLAARPGVIRIDSNENPVGPGALALEAIRQALGTSNRYPVLAEDDLAAAIAKHQGVSPDNVKLGCGSGELLRAAVHAFTAPDRPLVSRAVAAAADPRSCNAPRRTGNGYGSDNPAGYWPGRRLRLEG